MTPSQAFEGVNVGLLVGARPRSKGMERADLLEANGGIFKPQGKAINAGAADDVKILVVGNPANANALIAPVLQHPGRAAQALQRDDPPGPQPRDRAAGEEEQAPRSPTSPIWACGVTTHPRCSPTCSTRRWVTARQPRWSTIFDWYENEFLPTVGKRGAAIIDARGASSAASAANAAIDHVHDWVNGTREGDWVSMAVLSDGSYNINEGADIPASRARVRTVSGRSSRASTSATSRARRSRRR